MVADGIYYAVALAVGGGLAAYMAGSWWFIPFGLLAAFCLYFFRDPEREIPAGAVAVSPADGKIIGLRSLPGERTSISIFMSVFDVHVNRSPITGVVREVSYQPGRFLVASREEALSQNEQNSVTISGEGTAVVVRQIAGLVARRIVFRKKPGDRVRAGERIGLIKFGSRVDLTLGPEWSLAVREGDRVKAGSTIVARWNSIGYER